MEIVATDLMRIVDFVKYTGTPTRAKIINETLQVRLNTGSIIIFDISKLPAEKRKIMKPVLKQAFYGIKVEM